MYFSLTKTKPKMEFNGKIMNPLTETETELHVETEIETELNFSKRNRNEIKIPVKSVIFSFQEGKTLFKIIVTN